MFSNSGTLVLNLKLGPWPTKMVWREEEEKEEEEEEEEVVVAGQQQAGTSNLPSCSSGCCRSRGLQRNHSGSWASPELSYNTHTHTPLSQADVPHPVAPQVSSPGDVPLPVHEQLDVLDPAVVGVMEPLGQVLLQVRPEVLARRLTLKQGSR